MKYLTAAYLCISYYYTITKNVIGVPVMRQPQTPAPDVYDVFDSNSNLDKNSDHSVAGDSAAAQSLKG